MRSQMLLVATLVGATFAQTPNNAPADAPGDAPGDAPADPPTSIPADPIVAEQVQWCRNNNDCSLFGDTAATCTDRVCRCTAPGFTYLANTWGCFPREFTSIGQVSQTFLITMAMTFPDVDCQRFLSLNPTAAAELKTVIEAFAGQTITDSLLTCGSVNYGFEVRGTASTVQRLGTIERDLPARLGAVPALVDLANATFTATLSAAPSGACALDNANRTVAIENRCHALSCNTGYNVTTASSGINICLPSSMPADSDDDLTDAEIAGIVLGSVAVAACIIGLITAVGLGKGGSEEEQMSNKSVPVQSEQLEAPKEPEDGPLSPNAPFGVADDHAQPNDASGATTDGTEGTMVV